MSDRAQHTPGPWSLYDARPDGAGAIYINAGPAFIGSAHMAPVRAYECSANASLMAAAPDLLAELKRALEREHNPFEPDNQSAAYYRMQALIAKATGRAAAELGKAQGEVKHG